ncbi:kinesin-like protein KIN-12F [Helianthus annuus]|uniref:kinesin-like protein KIN-12F n=1 Tax=Helianthus annuus TaxID=4232 RepID=UPI001652B927|nr:kinesin-like protein KIN-12F [Helianthus annuus]
MVMVEWWNIMLICRKKYNELVEKHRLILEWIAEVKRVAAKARTKGHGNRFSKSLAAGEVLVRLREAEEAATDAHGHLGLRSISVNLHLCQISSIGEAYRSPTQVDIIFRYFLIV